MFEDPPEPSIVGSSVTYPTTKSSCVAWGVPPATQTIIWWVRTLNEKLNPFSRRGPASRCFAPAFGMYPEHFDHKLHKAAFQNDGAKARKSLEQGANPNQRCG